MSTRRAIHLLLIGVLMCIVNAPGVPVGAAGPDLRLRPDDGAVGETISARGRNFTSGAAGTVTWESVAEPLASFTADDDGAFEVSVTVPDLPAGSYSVTASTADSTDVTDDTFTIEVDEAATTSQTPMPAWMAGATEAATPGVTASPCTTTSGDEGDVVAVANAAELTAALAEVQGGQRIDLAAGLYRGNFVAAADGGPDAPILLCGSRAAVLDGGSWQGSGYGLHVTGDWWVIAGITVTNAQKGVMLDGASHVLLTGLEVHTTGHEAIHLRTHSSYNTVSLNDIHDTGLDNAKFGEGVYIGSAVSNWPKYINGDPDRSDRNRVIGNRIWATSSESIDLKEGTEGGEVRGNRFDGTGMSGADSWVDAKGNDYLIIGNTGVNSPQDGFQTHVIDNLGWGTGNTFSGNTATVNAAGVGFYIHQPEATTNIVRCDNIVQAASALSNLDPPCTN